MRLRRLTVKGFKSFADKTDFDFDAGLTGIVGPNGCGKSNVVDALKWVLGDQRAKSLRGAEMTDVIFKGAEGRDAMGVAEVTLQLEDPDGSFGGRTEVSIGRRLTRDKESHYLVNGEPVRLKDVRDLLMDTGLGVGAYSVMEQGRIDAVLSANPEDRRAIFEEAAGISKFKVQKRETLRKLERTELNLTRARDLLEDRARRIRSLKIQAGKARRYVEIRDQLRDLRAALAVVDARALRAHEADERERLAASETRLVECEARCETAAAELAALDQSIAGLEGELEKVQNELRDVQSRADAMRHRSVSAARRAEELRTDAEQCVQRLAASSELRAERDAALGDARRRLTELEAALVDLHRELEGRRTAARGAQAEVKALQEERERARDRVLHWIHERTRHKNQAHDCEAQLRSLGARCERVASRTASFSAERATIDAERAAGESAARDLGERRARLETRERILLAGLEHADADAAEMARLESGLRERLASVTSRLEVLQSMEAHYEGLDQGPKYLLESGAPGLRGRLIDALDVDLAVSKALEAALGPLVQALIVDHRANADAMLAALREHEKGRAILLVEDEFAASGSGDAGLDLPPGCEFLLRHVRCDERARPLLRWLLRGVCLCDSLAAARPDRHDLCFVTRDGALVCGPRLEGGLVEAQAGLVVRKAQIHSLRAEAEEFGGQLGGLQGEIAAARDRADRLKQRVRRLGVALAGVREREQSAVAQAQRARARLGDVDRELATLALEQREIDEHRCEALAGLGGHLLNEVVIRRSERAEAERESVASSRLDAARRSAEQAVQLEHDLRVRQASCSTDRDAHFHKVRDAEAALRELDRTVEELTARGRTAREGGEREAAEARRCSEEAAASAERVAVLGEQRERVQAALLERRERRSGVQEATRDAERQRSRFQQEVGELRMALTERRHRFVRIEERLRDDCGVELRRCLGEVHGFGLETRVEPGPASARGAVEVLLGPPLPPAWVAAGRALQRLWESADFDCDAARKDAQLLQAQVDRLGSVNLDAVAELAAEEERFGGLEKDVADLEHSRKSLMEALRRMELESRALFDATFEKARENFRGIFRKLFQGGRADMYLTESEDSLEAGIEIVAKPPGKELQSIALLSGGERSLTALAILFAVFQVKPSPFCILDEVDAALDETNVERFLRVLYDFVGPTQFCIVTHHKRTMAECQVLYGITMQKRGVSSRIAVALDEVDDFAVAAGAPGIDRALAPRIAGEEQIGF